MFCPHCGKEVLENAKFCTNCGKDLDVSTSQKDSLGSQEMDDKDTPLNGEYSTTPLGGTYTVPEGPIKKNKKPIYKRVWFWIVIVIVLIGILGSSGDDSDKNSNKESESTVSEEKKEEETSEEKTPQKLTALYLGDTEAGVEVNEDSNIEVTLTYDDGSEEKVTGWTIDSPITLEAGGVYTAKISYEGLQADCGIACTTPDEESYKGECQTISYDELARNPDEYSFTNITISGQVLQVQEDSTSGKVMMRIGTKDSGYGRFYDDVFLVEYTPKNGESRILEEDKITLWGTYIGVTSYTAVLGNKITLPAMMAEFIQIN